jgi:hypothetical protein
MQDVGYFLWCFAYFTAVFAISAYPAGKVLFLAYGKRMLLQMVIVVLALCTYLTAAAVIYLLLNGVFAWMVPTI